MDMGVKMEAETVSTHFYSIPVEVVWLQPSLIAAVSA